MAAPDKTHKMLLEHDDEFAEVFSILALDNTIKLDPKQLREAATEYEHVEHTKPAELRRDLVKLYGGFALGLVVCGFENQTSVDIRMPVRVMGYDWTRYRHQLEKAGPLNEKTRIAPVFTHVLNFSYKQRWIWPHSLRDLVNLPPELDDYFQDYKIKVTNLAWLTPEERALFTGDFRIVIEGLCEMRETGKITGIRQPVKYLESLLALFAAITGDRSFIAIDRSGFIGGKTTMCEIMEKWVNEIKTEGYNSGKVDGEKTGFANGERSSTIRTCKLFGKSLPETTHILMQELNLTQEQVNEALKLYW